MSGQRSSTTATGGSEAIRRFEQTIDDAPPEARIDLQRAVVWARELIGLNLATGFARPKPKTATLNLRALGTTRAPVTIWNDGRKPQIALSGKVIARLAPNHLEHARALVAPKLLGSSTAVYDFSEGTFAVLTSLYREASEAREPESSLATRRANSHDNTMNTSGAMESSAIRLVPAEENVVRRFAVSLPDEREVHRREGELVDRYRAYLDECGFRSSRVEMVFESVRLVNDLYIEPPRNQLVEAKGDIRRESIRMGIGQLLDYLHNIDGDHSFPDRPAPALLLPQYPGAPIEGLLDSQGIALVWEREDGSFEDNRRGRFT